MIHPELLSILCCPETRRPVHEAPAALLDRLHRAARAGALTGAAGTAVSEVPDAGLVTEDQRFLYPIRNGIPIMLVEERISIPAAAAVAGSEEKVAQDGDTDHHQMEPGPRT